ncbi:MULTISPECIES: SDR family NAD(P)-dependent oxidoreductase [Agrobacterium]|jgi:NAD(P)-dependent dehydrogenase (short-subunit alcohol dehydrogenase family)|nr:MULTISPECIES: SDR family oxidoreductase [Agrobacterium]MBN7806770.1 SDR family oxidoreductase [Agrobacterium rosae]MCM2435188.1 SDR family oxidoreductase [Agrobacterium rosae]MDX8304056.1 SDR family oxidoreductase [Agrobacterium rosae]MDX8314174.1 SDR family oxidoreductase [Agrobacterium rosae]MDX8331077.1 SDR family oxidoreductase [Agrobacterium rosae]
MAIFSKPGRIAVLGGAGGIGRALVDHLLGEGHEVIVLDLAASLARHTLPVTSFEIDILSEASIETAFKAVENHWDTMDGLVNLVGYNSDLRPISETTTDYFDEILEGNLRGAFICARRCLPLMAQDSAIVMVSSGLATHVRAGYGAYSMAKAGLIALTKTLAVENAPRIRVNAVAPGLVDTAFLRGGTGRSEEDKDAIINMEAYRNALPMKRLAVPNDVVGPIAFLLSDASRYMTGQVLWINGGGFMP